MQLKSILCPVDFSEFSAAAYQHALSLAEHYKARLVCLHIVELWKYPFADYAAYQADFAKFSRAIKEGGEQLLRDFVKKHSANGLRPELAVREGNASNCILSFAQAENVELIVMGTHGGRGFDRLLLGSTPDRVLRRASCPVLVVSNPSHNVVNLWTGRTPSLDPNPLLHGFLRQFGTRSGLCGFGGSGAGAELTVLHVVEHAPECAEHQSAHCYSHSARR